MNARLRRVLRDDRGTTVLEMIVAMTLLTVFMGIFTTSVIMMTRTTTKVQNTAQAVEDGNSAFLTLDRTLRYATAVSVPQFTSTIPWNVEIASTTTTNGVTTDWCTQLRVTTATVDSARPNQLQSRQWRPAGTTYATGSLTAWKPLASNLTNATAATSSPDRPFLVPPLNAAAPTVNQSLTVTLLTAAGTGGNLGVTQRTSSTFTALNSTNDPPTSVCQQVGATS